MTLTLSEEHLITQLEKAQQSINQLEADKAAYMKDVDDIARERNLYEQRIQKVQGILQSIHGYWEECKCIPCQSIRRVLEALEGK